MRKHEINERLKQIVSDITPDVMDQILTLCKDKEGWNDMRKEKENKELALEEKKEKVKFFNPKLLGAVAAMFICAFGIFGFTQYQNANYSVDSIIDFDVNPSVEIKVNKKEEIIEANALNDDGEKILEDMDLERVDLEVGVNAIIGSMLKNGYITEAQNSILVSVKNDDGNKAKYLEEKISKDINDLLSAQNIEGSVLSQLYNDDDLIEQLAKDNNVSEGKANLINKALNSNMTDSKGNAYTFDSLSKLSINELNVLLNSKDVVLDQVTSTGSANEKAYIGKDKAREIALEKAGVTESSIYNYEIEFDCDDGILIYEVEFDTKQNEYEYDINAKDGKIVKSSVEANDDRDDDRDDNRQNANNNTSSNTSTTTNTQTTTNSKPTSTVTNNSYKYDDDRDDDRDDDYDDRYDDDRDDDYDDRYDDDRDDDYDDRYDDDRDDDDDDKYDDDRDDDDDDDDRYDDD